MMLFAAILALAAHADPDALPTRMELQEDEGPHRPGGLRPVEREAESDPV